MMAREVKWDGKTYPSISAAARVEGVSAQTMIRWLDLEPINKSRSVSLTIRGKSYPSIRAASRDLGISPNTLSLARKMGREQFAGLRGKR